tara:strand:- start:6796 stop:7833 length:1038 start_codon:yes stop_codon:yes gene_type:complete
VTTPTSTQTSNVPSDREPLLTVEDFSLDLAPSGEFVPVLSDVDLTVRSGEVVGLVGESGSGKSTLAMSLMGLVPKKISRRRSGRIALGDIEITGAPRRALQSVRGSKIGMIFQEPMTALDPAYRVGDQVAEAIRRHTGVSRTEARKRAIENFKLVEVADAERRADAYPHELSGGLRQRVCIALAIACRPQVLIADEPTTALDVTTQAQVLDLLRRLRDELGMAVILISHDLAVIAEFCDRVMVMYAGQIVEASPIDPFFIEPEHPYSSALLQSLPENQPPLRALSVLPGSPPPLGMEVAGCRFAARCAHMVEGTCDVAPIPLTARGDRAFRCVRADELDLPGAAR